MFKRKKLCAPLVLFFFLGGGTLSNLCAVTGLSTAEKDPTSDNVVRQESKQVPETGSVLFVKSLAVFYMFRY